MKIVYLILAHNHPRHLRRLVAALSSPSSSFLIHLDRKVNYSDFAEVANVAGADVVFTQERTAVYWGDFSQVEATLILLREACAGSQQPKRMVLLSGVDYPIRSTAAIERFFEVHAANEFIDLVPMPCPQRGKPLSRLTTFHSRINRYRLPRLIIRVLAQIGIGIRTREYRTIFGDRQPYAGATWWALTDRACRYLLDEIDRDSTFFQFYEHAVCSDEMLFHTLIGNSGFKEQARSSLTYADWSAGRPSPAMMTQDHVRRFASEAQLEAPTYLFARKFADNLEHVVLALERQRAQENNEQGDLHAHQTSQEAGPPVVGKPMRNLTPGSTARQPY